VKLHKNRKSSLATALLPSVSVFVLLPSLCTLALLLSLHPLDAFSCPCFFLFFVCYFICLCVCILSRRLGGGTLSSLSFLPSFLFVLFSFLSFFLRVLCFLHALGSSLCMREGIKREEKRREDWRRGRKRTALSVSARAGERVKE